MPPTVIFMHARSLFNMIALEKIKRIENSVIAMALMETGKQNKKESRTLVVCSALIVKM